MELDLADDDVYETVNDDVVGPPLPKARQLPPPSRSRLVNKASGAAAPLIPMQPAGPPPQAALTRVGKGAIGGPPKAGAYAPSAGGRRGPPAIGAAIGAPSRVDPVNAALAASAPRSAAAAAAPRVGPYDGATEHRHQARDEWCYYH